MRADESTSLSSAPLYASPLYSAAALRCDVACA
jgi:hypothetical protein